ncbi:MAG: GRP family sugar transporter [Cytophagales bacterium]|nr:GRP family sugar transporter [Cytophagales bacterium]
MFILQSYPISVIFCVITMLCWGSWANTMRLTHKGWSFTLYYWDYSIGLVLTSLFFGFTLGSYGELGRSFVKDLGQAQVQYLLLAFVGGVIFNLSNILIVVAIEMAGMAIAFPIAVGLALSLGVIINYLAAPVGNPTLLFIGLICIVLAIILSALAYKQLPQSKGATTKGILISVISGLLMSVFYRFVAASMATNVAVPEAGLLTSYSAMFIFTIGIFLSNFVWNTWMMYMPIYGEKTTYQAYFKEGNLKTHLMGIAGGFIWNLGMTFNLIAASTAGFAISYGLGQGATMVAATWGVFVWKEFKNAPALANQYIRAMFTMFIIGLGMIIISKVI